MLLEVCSLNQEQLVHREVARNAKSHNTVNQLYLIKKKRKKKKKKWPVRVGELTNLREKNYLKKM